MLAGLVAGAAAAAFHSVLTEPVIDQAIEIEERSSQSQGSLTKEPVVSRTTQRVGLILGFLFYGVAWGLLFSVIFPLARSWFPEWSGPSSGLVLTIVLGWSVAMFPFLKYPANPPGVGDPETIGYRQALFLGFMGLSVIGAVLYLSLQRRLSQGKNSGRIIALSFYVVYLVMIYLAMPPNPDPMRMPVQLVYRFRALSLAGLLLFWGAMGCSFWWFYRLSVNRQT